jgi:lysophospholipase L1-like esterase
MRLRNCLLSLILISASAPVPLSAQGRNSPPAPDRLVVVGDSLSAGVQNFSLLFSQQPRGYASVIARQAGWPLTLPLVPYPGAPTVLHLVQKSPPIVEPVKGTLLFPRLNPLVQPTNVAVPGITVGGALSLRPNPSSIDPQTQWASIVLGFPSLYQGKAPTEIELANSLHPKTLIEWLGNNDALVPALIGHLELLTPLDAFQTAYEQVLSSFSLNGGRLITATIPDVTKVAYFTSVPALARQVNLTPEAIAAALQIHVDDYVRPSAQTYITNILTGKMTGPLPADCPPPLPDLGVATLPCVLTAADAQTIRNVIQAYNQVITTTTQAHGGVVVDIHALVDQIYANGYRLPGTNIVLTTDFLGGLFSLDGIHPTDTGYGVIANEFIRKMDEFYQLKIPQANVLAIFLTDPLRPDASPKIVPHS